MTDAFNILSREAVKGLQGKFRQTIRRRTEKAITEAGLAKDNLDVLAAAEELVMAVDSQRQALVLHDTLAKNKTAENIRKEAHRVQSLRHGFQASQLQEISKAAQERLEPEQVKAVFGNEDRLYLKGSADLPSQAKAGVAEALKKMGYVMVDYKAGKATDGKQKQLYRIGKLLAKTPELLKQYMEDPARSQERLMVVVSRNPKDIARMSTNRAWTSCMNAVNGERWHCVPEAVRQGALVAYLVSENDVEINNPLARMTIMPFRDQKGRVLYQAEKAYGLANNAFQATVNAFVERELNRGLDEGRFHVADGVFIESLALAIVRRDDLLGELAKPPGAMDAKKAQAFLESGKGLNERDDDAMSAIHHVAKNNHSDFLPLLIANGADINKRAYNGYTPLHSAVMGKNTEMAYLLLDAGADISAVSTITKTTALHLAILSDNEDLAMRLVERGADPNARTVSGETPLYLAVGKNHLRLAHELIKRSVDVNSENRSGWTSLYRAAFEGKDDMAILLIGSGADPTLKTTSGRVPLDNQWAFQRRETTEIIRRAVESRKKPGLLSRAAQRMRRWF